MSWCARLSHPSSGTVLRRWTTKRYRGDPTYQVPVTHLYSVCLSTNMKNSRNSSRQMKALPRSINEVGCHFPTDCSALIPKQFIGLWNSCSNNQTITPAAMPPSVSALAASGWPAWPQSHGQRPVGPLPTGAGSLPDSKRWQTTSQQSRCQSKSQRRRSAWCPSSWTGTWRRL